MFLMCSCVFWCESSIDLVIFFLVVTVIVTHVNPFIRRSKGCTEKKQPAVRTLFTRRRFGARKPIESRIFWTRGKVLSSLHLRKRLKRNIPTHVAGNEHFIPPCPNTFFRRYWISRVDIGRWPEVKIPSTERGSVNLTEIQFQDLWFELTWIELSFFGYIILTGKTAIDIQTTTTTGNVCCGFLLTEPTFPVTSEKPVSWRHYIDTTLVPAAWKRSHQWCLTLTQKMLKQLTEEWHVIVSCDQLGETSRTAPTPLGILDTLSMTTWLVLKLDEIRYIINTLKSGIHLISYTETWLNSSVLDEEVSIPGYTVFRKDRGSKGGGVIVYARDDLSVIRRSDLERPDVEGLWLEITLPKSRSFLFGTFYRPPSSSKHTNPNFMSVFSDTIESLSVENKEVLVLGDFNCDFSAKKTTQPECKQMKCLFNSLSFSQLIYSPTRIASESSRLIDLIATNNP